MTLPLWQWSACDLAQAIRSKKVSSEEVVQSHLDRIDAINHTVNAVTVVLRDDALNTARKADNAIAAGEEIGPLHGLPITVKENIDVVGSATTHGIVNLKDSLPTIDAPVIAHLRRAGAIPIGRTNQPDFGLRWHTDNDLHGATVNPWDPSRTPGGSSGGEAVAIAMGMSPLGIGNDMGGSIRYPVQCCGIAGLKPSLGRVSRILTSLFSEPPLFYDQLAAVNGPMARHIKDLRLALNVMSQSDPNDPWWTPASPLNLDRFTPMRVAMTIDPAGFGCCPKVEAGIRRAADVLAHAGHVIDEVNPPLVKESTTVLERIVDIEMKSYLDDMLDMMSKNGQTVLRRILEIGNTAMDLSTYMKAIGERHRIAQAWSLFMNRYPLVLGPVSTRQPFEVGYDLSGIDELSELIQSIRLTEICNLLGLPSVAVPVYIADGLPQAVQIIGWRGQDDLCLDTAETIEQQLGILTPIEPRPVKTSGTAL